MSSRFFRFSGIVVALTILVTSVSVEAIEYGGFGGRPAYPRADNSRTDSIFLYTLEPGAVQKEGVKVINNTQEKKTFIVYAADSTPSTDGAFACEQFVEPKDDVGAWIALEKSEVTLAPSTNEIVPFTITVAKTAGIGEHNGCILIQEKKAAAEGDKAGMSLSIRTGIRAVITIPGDLIRKLEIVDFTLEKTAKSIILRPKVKSLGNVSIDADAKVTTRYFFGPVLIKHGGQYPILRGDTSNWSFELKRPFLGGLYRSQFTVTYDESKDAAIGVKTDAELTVLKSQTLWFWSMPTLAGGAIEIIILLGIIALLYLANLAKKRKQWIKTHWVTHTLSAQTDIITLATEYDVSWKLLAKVNKLQPPYSLKIGDVLKVPPMHTPSTSKSDAPVKTARKRITKK